MPMVDYLPLTLCPREGYRRSWWIFGRDAELIHSLATFTHQVDGCVQVYRHDDPLVNLTNGKYHVYGHAMYWSPHMMGHVRYLYPHAQDPICFIMRRAGFVKREIFSAFMVEVYIFIGVYLLMVILILRFGFQVDVLQAVTEATETFLTGTFVDSRRSLMIWGSIFSLIVLNSFSGVFTSFLAVPKRGYEINTLEELTQNFDYIITSVQLRQAFLSKVDTSDHPKLFALFDNKKPIEEITNFRYPRMDSESHIKISQLEKWKSVELRQMKECMWSSAFVSFAVAKNWDLADRYDRLLMRLVQAGVVEKASADSWSNYSLYFWGRIVHGTSSHTLMFSLGHLVEAFIILCAGIGAGLLCFLAELAPSLWTRFNEFYDTNRLVGKRTLVLARPGIEVRAADWKASTLTTSPLDHCSYVKLNQIADFSLSPPCVNANVSFVKHSSRNALIRCRIPFTKFAGNCAYYVSVFSSQRSGGMLCTHE